MNDLQLQLPGLIAIGPVEWVWQNESDGSESVSTFEHTTVMKQEVVEALSPRSRGIYVDVTLGGGGHTEAILESCADCRVIAFDRDPYAVLSTRERLASFGDRLVVIPRPFSAVHDELSARGISHIDGLCADLGVSSPQLDDAARGLSFRQKGPLDMRMDPDNGETALELIARSDEEELANILFRLGEERRSRRIARSIRRAYEQGELETTLDLRRAIVRAVGPARVGGVDPATRTFQALRLAVNDELGELESLLEQLPRVLASDGIAAVLSFHSLEDRLVKRAFADKSVWAPLTKKPRVVSDEEAATNPRSRSAKFRAARLLGASA